MLPAPVDIPSWVREVELPEVPEFNVGEIGNAKIDTSEWGKFKVGDIFKIAKGVNIPKYSREKGSTPYISGSRFNNGMMDEVRLTSHADIGRVKKDALTINNNGSVGYCFFHDYEFIASDSATVIEFKDSNIIMTERIGIFLTVLFEKIGEKYSYARKIGDNKLLSEVIKLPIDEHSDPDWKAVEEFTKFIEYEGE